MQVIVIIYLKQAMFLVYIRLQLFCIYNLCYIIIIIIIVIIIIIISFMQGIYTSIKELLE